MRLLNDKNLITGLKLFILVTIFVFNCDAVEIPPDRLRLKNNVECYIPYLSNLPIDTPNEKVTHLIIAIHASKHNIYGVFNDCTELLKTCHKDNGSIVILAPQFLLKEHLNENSEENLLFWNVSPFYGSSISSTKAFDADLRISAYDVLEDIIGDYCEKKIFPNLDKITILGHSAGGQLVNRFAASNTVEFDKVRPQNIHIRYIAMNPSSYVYFSPKRSVNWSPTQFEIPSEEMIINNQGFNNYSYGLNALYSYHRAKRLTPEKIRELYPQRNVIYLLGEKDCVPDGSMSTNPAAVIQGRNRLERGRIYLGHLVDEFGVQIKENQKLLVAKGVAHDGRGCIMSSPGRISILK